MFPNDSEAIRVYLSGSGYVAGVDDRFVEVCDIRFLIGMVGFRTDYGVENFQNNAFGFNVAEQFGNVSDYLQSYTDNKVNQITNETIVDYDEFVGEYVTFTVSSSDIITTSYIEGSNQSHNALFFEVGKTDVSFKHIKADDWTVIGGASNASFSAVAIGNYNVRLADLGAVVRVVDIDFSPPIELNEYIRIFWIGDVLNIHRSADRILWSEFAVIDMLAEAPTIVNWIDRKIMGSTTQGQVKQYLRYGVETLADRVIRLESRASYWTGKFWNVVGDSITQTGYYIPFVSAYFDLNYDNFGLASSTIAINNTYLQNKSVVERVLGENGNDPYENADLWTIFAGTNDWNYETPLGTIQSTLKSTFYGALKAIAEDLLSRENNPVILFITPLQSNRTGVNADGVYMIEYRNAIIDVCQSYSIPYIDLYSVGGINAVNLNTYTSDGLHPTMAGTAVFYPRIIDAIASSWRG
jgi:lysophospholipase L1-like esterase